jgi:hypothetical protein
LLQGRRLDGSAERVLFVLVANRALAPSSKLRSGSAEARAALPHQGRLPTSTASACRAAATRRLSNEDIALGLQATAGGRAWPARDLKQVIDLSTSARKNASARTYCCVGWPGS